MKIEKTTIDKNNYTKHEIFYRSAREAMFDVLRVMKEEGYFDTVLLPGYIGWSPREGSGIFDPIAKIENINIKYYKMTSDLEIDEKDLISKLENQKTVVLLVNYFGFRDKNFEELAHKIKECGCWVIEDNAHGFYTYTMNKSTISDATFFSHHKMFPFEEGGSLVLHNEKLRLLAFNGNLYPFCGNPYTYDIVDIAKKRINNYKILDKLIRKVNADVLQPLKNIEFVGENIPQTYPIVIREEKRNELYEYMNNEGFGIVSLYHTLIDPLRNEDHKDALWLSKHIMNLPVHQDTNTEHYKEMIEKMIHYLK